MRMLQANGAGLAWLIDPSRKAVEVYRPGREVEVVEDGSAVEGMGRWRLTRDRYYWIAYYANFLLVAVGIGELCGLRHMVRLIGLLHIYSFFLVYSPLLTIAKQPRTRCA
jgi:hypothetical protein